MKKWPLFILLGAAALLIGTLVLRTEGDGAAQAQTGPGEAAADAQEAARARAEIQNDPVAPTFAPKGYDVTLVMFTDYQCPYCRKVHPVLEELKRSDPKVRIVYRDWPIFGAPSVEAARAAIASTYQGKHAAFNDALMAMPGKVSSQGIRAAADKAGVEWNRLQADLERHDDEIDAALGRTSKYAAMMGLSGTPALLVGPYLIPGAIDIAGLRGAVELARTAPNGTAAK